MIKRIFMTLLVVWPAMNSLELLEIPSRKLSNEETYYNFLQNNKPGPFIAFMTKYYTEVKKVNLSYQSPKRNTYLHAAAAFDHVNLLALFIERGLDINAQNSDGQTPLHIAISRNQLNAAQELVKLKARVDIADNDAFTAINLVDQKLRSTYASDKLFDDLEKLLNTMCARSEGI